jgi:hypothetical protein
MMLRAPTNFTEPGVPHAHRRTHARSCVRSAPWRRIAPRPRAAGSQVRRGRHKGRRRGVDQRRLALRGDDGVPGARRGLLRVRVEEVAAVLGRQAAGGVRRVRLLRAALRFIGGVWREWEREWREGEEWEVGCFLESEGGVGGRLGRGELREWDSPGCSFCGGSRTSG